MNVNNITPYFPITKQSRAQQFYPAVAQQSASPFFRRDALEIGGTASPHQTYTASHAFKIDNLRTDLLSRQLRAQAFSAKLPANSKDSFNIRNYYTIPPEEVEPTLCKLREEVLENDFSGMTDEEIHEWIEHKFIGAFGKDFMAGYNLLASIYNTGANLLGMNPNRASNDQYMLIGINFRDMGNYIHSFSNNAFSPEIYRKRLYGDMSDMEIMDALMAKYPQPMTNRSLAMMTGELRNIGLPDLGMTDYVYALTVMPGESPNNDNMPSWDVLEERWNKVIDEPANLSILYAKHNEIMSDRTLMSNPYVIQIRDLLMKLEGKLGSDGLFLHDLDDEFLEMLRR